MTRQQRFIQQINHIIMACGYVTETYADTLIRNFDFVTMPSEEMDNSVIFELTCLCNHAADGRAKEVYNCAKRIHEIMRDCHMI